MESTTDKKPKKKFRDTGLGKFLSTTAPKVLDVVGDVLPSNGVLGIVKNLIDREPDLTTEQRAALIDQVQLFEKEMALLDVQDRDSAREMQMEALKQENVLSKVFVYYLGAFMLLSATSFGVMLFFVEFPEENRRLIEMFVDIFLFSGAVTVLNFFLGSSKGSVDKSKQLLKP
jgi:hypothetical protein